MRRLLPAVIAIASIALSLAGWFLQYDREIDIALIYPTPQRTELTVKYRVPPPPEGKVYVLWTINGDQGRRVKVGQIPPASRVTAVKTTLDLFVTGVVISIESDPNVAGMSNTWAPKAGRLDPATPQATPSVLGKKQLAPATFHRVCPNTPGVQGHTPLRPQCPRSSSLRKGHRFCSDTGAERLRAALPAHLGDSSRKVR